MADTSLTAALVGICGVLGLLVGSFLNVVIWRVPRGESIVSPPSHCPGCETPIRPRDNVPVFGWLLLKGRCRACGVAISPRYPLVEFGTGVVFVALSWRILALGHPWAVPAYLYLGAIAIALALIDIDVKRLPDAITLPSYAVVGLLLLLPTVAERDWSAGVRAFVGMAALYGFYFSLAVIKPGGMGWGDVKLSGVLGLALGWLGWRELVVGSFLAFLLGGVIGALLVVLSRQGTVHPAEVSAVPPGPEGDVGLPPAPVAGVLKAKIPYGPYMLLGALLGVFWGSSLADVYLSRLNR